MENQSSNREIIFLSQPDTVSMADEWFEIANKDHFWMAWRFRVIQNQLNRNIGKLLPEGNYLEVGCGHGQFINQLESHNNISVDGCDLNLYALKKVKNARGEVYVYNIFAKHTSMINKYDDIFLLDVIEHIDNDALFLDTTLAHLKKGGNVIINVPALTSLFSKYDTQAGHKRRYSVKDIEKLFQVLNIEPLYIGYWGFGLLPIALIRKFYLRGVSTEEIISKGFAPPSPFINILFKFLMKIELFLIKNPPLGTSVIAIGKKK